MNQLGFEAREKRFGYGILSTVGFSTHALYETVAVEVVAKAGASILDASIGVDHQASIRLAVYRARSGALKHQPMIQITRKAPTDNFTRKQVDEYRQTHPALLQTDVGNIAALYPIGCLDLEAASESAGSNRKSMLRLGRYPKTAMHDRAQVDGERNRHTQ